MRDVRSKMASVFPEGMHGRLLDLVQPVDRRYNTAVSIALGRHMDSVVVDSRKTALEIVQWLNKQRYPPMNFLPLDSLRVDAIDENLRALPADSYHLAVDVLSYEPSVARAVERACGNTVVCESLNDARTLCFDMKHRVKAVTLHGEVISRSGTMTGGVLEKGDAASASRFDQRDLQHLRDRREKLLRERTTLDALLSRGSTAPTAPAADEARRRVPYASAIADAETRLAHEQTKYKYAHENAEQVREAVDRLEGSRKEARAKLEELRPKIQEVRRGTGHSLTAAATAAAPSLRTSHLTSPPPCAQMESALSSEDKKIAALEKKIGSVRRTRRSAARRGAPSHARRSRRWRTG